MLDEKINEQYYLVHELIDDSYMFNLEDARSIEVNRLIEILNNAAEELGEYKNLLELKEDGIQ